MKAKIPVFKTLILLAGAALVAPLSLTAQDQKRISRTQIITGKDTLYLDRTDNGIMITTGAAIAAAKDSIPKRKTKKQHVLVWRDSFDDDFPNHVRVYRDDMIFNGDSVFKDFGLRVRPLDTLLRDRLLPRLTPGRFFGTTPFGGPAENTTSLSFDYVDRDGISNRIYLRINDATSGQYKQVTGNDLPENTLTVNDLTIFPNFSSNQLSISFKLKDSGGASVSVYDSSQSQIHSGSSTLVNGMHWVQMPMPKNGFYYLAITQKGITSVKRMVKQ